MKKVISTCIYCGCGCKLTYHIENNKIIKISGFKEDYMSEGKPCIKGLTINEVWNKNRIKTPHIRKNGKLVKCSWEEAIERIYQETKSLKPEEIFFNGSGKITNEDNLLIYKLGTCLYNTKNIDSCCGRLCHISTVKGVVDCFGAPNLTDIKNLNKTDCLFIIGSNPAVNYPVFWNKVLKRKKQIKIISVQPLQNLTSKFGNIFLEIEPGAETALLNGIINYLIQNKKFNKTAVNFPQFQKLKTLVSTYTPEYVLKHTGIKEKDFLNACQQIADCKQLSIFHGMGFTQHINSLENIYSLLNLVLLKDAHILTLRGEINVQGVGDVFSSDPKILSKLWGKQIKKPQGNLINSLFLKPVKAAFITEFNPAQSLPNLEAVYKKLQKMFRVYIGSYFNITCHYADVILPIPALFECL
ncbi:MAG: molybdopterin oxidoreductase family protein, partial [Candidatus Nanoarchaeia archaeon]